MISVTFASSPSDLVFEHVFYDFSELLSGSKLLLKLEGFNPAGSIKMKAAIEMIDQLEKEGRISPKTNSIIESSSGNLGVALGIVCKARGYHFVCVTDPNISPVNERYIKLYGATLIKVNELDENGGFLNTRIRLIKKLMGENGSLVWLNQYANLNNKGAHFKRTAPAIFNSIPMINYLFVGAGTTGTLMGCLEYARKHSPHTKVVAVDSIGSVTFGFPPGKRYIPGLGTSRVPELVEPDAVDDIIMVPERDTVDMCCRMLKERAFFMGGSTGTVLSAIKSYTPLIGSGQTVVAISPDFGDRYIDTIYDKDWTEKRFPSALPIEVRATRELVQ